MNYRIVVFKYGEVQPSEVEAQQAIFYVFNNVDIRNSVIQSIKESIENTRKIQELRLYSYTGFPKDPNDQIGHNLQAQYPNETIFKFGLFFDNGLAFLVCFILPTSEGSRIFRNELLLGGISPDSASPSYLIEKKRLSLKSDIREILSGCSFNRTGLVLASSPGWDNKTEGVFSLIRSPLKNKTQESDISNKNQGNLETSINDCNAFFQVLLALTKDDRLKGSAYIGTVRTRLAALRLMEFFATGKEKPIEELQKNKLLSGIVVKDTKIGAIDWAPRQDKQAYKAILKGGEILGGSYEFDPSSRLMDFSNRLVSSSDKTPSYMLLYYSGHGSSDGNIQIEANQKITPEELADFSISINTPFFIVLDMCHAARFGARYAKYLNKKKWTGIVMCSNDDNTQDGLTFATRRLRSSRHFPILPVTIEIVNLEMDGNNIKINHDNLKEGFSIYTTAFCLGLLHIREIERGINQQIDFNVEDFNNKMLRPLCASLSSTFNLPLIKPIVFSDETAKLNN
jgi:hypothetical protein